MPLPFEVLGFDPEPRLTTELMKAIPQALVALPQQQSLRATDDQLLDVTDYEPALLVTY